MTMAKKYIEREAAYNAIVKNYTTDAQLRDLDAIPAADVVEVVRKPVTGYEGYYEVDQFGRVYSLERVVSVDDNGRKYRKPISGKLLKQRMHTQGYKVVSLTKAGKTKSVYVHRIVAMAFLPNPNELPFINHIDEDKTNNFVENLEWCTVQYNNTYGRAREKQAKALRGKSHTAEHKQKIASSLLHYYEGENTHNRKVICLENDVVYPSTASATRELGISQQTVWQSCIRNAHKGRRYTFRFYDGERRDGGQEE